MLPRSFLFRDNFSTFYLTQTPTTNQEQFICLQKYKFHNSTSYVIWFHYIVMYYLYVGCGQSL